MSQTPQELPVYTPLGRGKMVYAFPDGTVAVELQHGGGHIFFAEEVYRVVATAGVIDPCRHGKGQGRLRIVS